MDERNGGYKIATSDFKGTARVLGCSSDDGEGEDVVLSRRKFL